MFERKSTYDAFFCPKLFQLKKQSASGLNGYWSVAGWDIEVATTADKFRRLARPRCHKSYLPQ
jgi:hypothetical protein